MVASFVFAPVGEWFIELARAYGWYENPKETAEGFATTVFRVVDGLSAWIMGSLRDPNWFTVVAGMIFALTAGFWADTWLARRERRALPTPEPAAPPEPILASHDGWGRPPNYTLWMLADEWSVSEGASILNDSDPIFGLSGDATMYAKLMIQALSKREILIKTVSYATPSYGTRLKRDSVIEWAKAKNIAADVVAKLEASRPKVSPSHTQ